MSKMIFQFKPGAHLSGDAQAVGERLDQLRSSAAGLTPEAVLQDAKAPASVLHSYFEWDDSKAANTFRLHQAGHIIRSVTVTIEDLGADTRQDVLPLVTRSLPAEEEAPRMRAFVPVQRTTGQRVYESTAVALTDGEYRRQVLASAHSELVAITRKHRELQELAEVVAAVEKVGDILRADRLDTVEAAP